MVPVFKDVEGRSAAKTFLPLSLLSVVRKVFEKLVNDRLVDHPKKCGLFSNFQDGFWSSLSTTNFLTAVSVRIARALNRSEATHLF